MMVQFSNVKFSAYQARYSPLTVQLRTTTFFACQNASFVSKLQFSITESVTYWKEYFPLKLTLLNFKLADFSAKYSPAMVLSLMLTFLQNQPNSTELTSQPSMWMFSHSRSALMPCNLLFCMEISRVYHNAARQSSVM